MKRMMGFVLVAALSVLGELRDGIIPAGCDVLTLAKLPDSPSSSSVVRLSPSGRPLTLFNGRIVSLAQSPDEPLFDWAPLLEDGGALRDFCWLDAETPVLLQETRLKIIRNGTCVVNYTLPVKNLCLARAGTSHCYLFGGGQSEVLLLGTDGSVSNLLHSPEPVTAVAGDGKATFVATGTTVWFLSDGNQPKPVFIAQSPVENLAISPSGAVFYTTKKGAGYLKAPGQNLLFLPQKIISLDSRADRLLLLTDERDIVMFEPVSGFDNLFPAASVGNGP